MMIRIGNITSSSRSFRGVTSQLLFSSASLASSSLSSSSLSSVSCCGSSNSGSKQRYHPAAPPSFLVADNRRWLSTATASPSVAQLVKQLREATGAPMMECKRALSDPSVCNDLTKAMEWLRKHGSAKALSKVVGREALEGLVGIHIINNNSATGGSVASIVRVASETDFASRSEVLSSFVQEVANAAADASATAAATNTTTNTIVENIPSFLKQTKTSSSTSSEDNSKTLDQCLSDTILAIRENLQVDCITTVQASSQKSIFGGYVHGRASPMSTCGSAASIVELVPITTSASTTTSGSSSSSSSSTTTTTATSSSSSSAEAARKLAMHIVAAKPTYLNIDTVPHDVIAKEKEILHGKMISDGKTVGKPPDIIDKIIQGQLRKYYESVCLTEQIHMIEEGGVKVSKVLSDLGLEVKSFQLVGLGK